MHRIELAIDRGGDVRRLALCLQLQCYRDECGASAFTAGDCQAFGVWADALCLFANRASAVHQSFS
jgi:hypothetical protein